MTTLAIPARRSGGGMGIMALCAVVVAAVLALSRVPVETVTVETVTVDTFTVTMPEGPVPVVVGPHALTKHEAGTMPASVIRAQVELGNYSLWYSAKRGQYLALVRMGNQCGGVVMFYDANAWHAATAFGGSEATRQFASSCEYWAYVIARDEYVPVAVTGG